MRRLIRAASFAVVQLAIFNSVAALVVGYVSPVDLECNVDPHRIELVIDSAGWDITWIDTMSNPYVMVTASVTDRGMLGAVAAPLPGGGLLSMSHWFSTTTSTLSYLLLKFIYRKRPSPKAEDAVCEG